MEKAALVVGIMALILVGIVIMKINMTLKNKRQNINAIPIGDQGCTVDWDCNGWSLFGDVACCNEMCVEKQHSLQSCDSYCAVFPVQCTPHVGR